MHATGAGPWVPSRVPADTPTAETGRPPDHHPLRSRWPAVPRSRAHPPALAPRERSGPARAPRLLGSQPRLAGRFAPSAPALTRWGSSRRAAAGAARSRPLPARRPAAGSPGSRCAARPPRPPPGESRPAGPRTVGWGSWREAGLARAPLLGRRRGRSRGRGARSACLAGPARGTRRPGDEGEAGCRRLAVRAPRAAVLLAGGEITSEGSPRGPRKKRPGPRGE